MSQLRGQREGTEVLSEMDPPHLARVADGGDAELQR